MIKFFKNFLRKKGPIIQPRHVVKNIKTQAIATVSNYALTEGKIYDVDFMIYSDGNLSWFLFTRDDGHLDSSHNWRFKLLSDWRNEQIDKILKDDDTL